MKKTVKCLFVHIYQMLFQPTFFLLAFAVCLLMLMTEVYYNGILGEEHKTLLELILFQGKSWIATNVSVSSVQMLLLQPQRGLADYIVILTALPFVELFFKERKSKVLRSRIQREGKVRFGITRMIAGVLVGGLCVEAGTLVFWCLISYYLPNGMDASSLQLELYGSADIKEVILQQCLKLFLYGCIASLYSAILAAFTQDIYICLMVPFLFCWMLMILKSYLTDLLDLEYPNKKGIIWDILRWIKEYGRIERIMEFSLLHCFLITIVALFFSTAIFELRLLARRDQGA